jgi:hypothetical protein
MAEMQKTQERFSAKAKGVTFALLHFSNTWDV